MQTASDDLPGSDLLSRLFKFPSHTRPLGFRATSRANTV